MCLLKTLKTADQIDRPPNDHHILVILCNDLELKNKKTKMIRINTFQQLISNTIKRSFATVNILF